MGKLADAFIEISSSDAKLNAGLETAKVKLTQFTTGANSLLATVGLGLGAAGFVKFLQDATMKGSDLNETMSKVEQVFGKASGTVTGMANEMANKFGSVKGETLDAAANLGLVAQGAGMSAQAAANMSVKLTKLADDASSFYNVPLAVALEKIRAGMVGEAEPLRAFGVLLSEANMKAAALTMGLHPVRGELTEQEKVMARVKIITEGLSKAQGDHERTMDGYANKIRKLTGDVKNFKAGIGASMAGVEAETMGNIEKEGIWYAFDKFMNNLWDYYEGRENTFQKVADVAAGVQHGFKPPQPEPFKIEVLEREGDAFAAMRNVGMPGLGMPLDMMLQLGAGSLRAGVTKQIIQTQQELREKDRAWGGGHVMDTESFMKRAQEKLLTPQDETLKKQLEELRGMRATLDKMAGMKPMAPQGMVLKGREQ